jgi:hypothetical protein
MRSNKLFGGHRFDPISVSASSKGIDWPHTGKIILAGLALCRVLNVSALVVGGNTRKCFWIPMKGCERVGCYPLRSFIPRFASPQQFGDYSVEDDNKESASMNRELNIRKLGINFGSMMDPLSDREAADIKAAAAEIVNDAIAAGIDDIGKLRVQLQKEFQAARQESLALSDKNAQVATSTLLSKIDSITNTFLDKTEESRESTKNAARADGAMSGRGLEYGVWGTLGGSGAAVALADSNVVSRESQTLMGSVDSAASSFELSQALESKSNSKRPSLLVIADLNKDAYAKQILPLLTKELGTVLGEGNPVVTTYSPTATVPVGGNNADCVVIFATSVSERSTMMNLLDRILRKTLATGGEIGQPPTQLVLVSTIGTTRTNQMPYSMRNMMNGGQYDKRREMEEAMVSLVRNREVTPALDYTIAKFGEMDGKKQPFNFGYGDCFESSIDPVTASIILTQAMVLQPMARNNTFSCVGTLPTFPVDSVQQQDFLDDWFLRLDGPEILRIPLDSTVLKDVSPTTFNSLAEFVREWSELLRESKGLTTPVRVNVKGLVPESRLSPVVKQAYSVQLLFVPTATGKNYMGKKEEAVSGKSSSSGPVLRDNAQEGGIELLVEITSPAPALRVRAKRCNYGPDIAIRELSEETILSRLTQSILVWQKNQEESS